MPNEYGDLNMIEAAKYLGVAPDILESLRVANRGPTSYPDRSEEHMFPDWGPWFPVWALDQWKPIMFVELRQMGLPHITAEAPGGAAKSVWATTGRGGR